MIGWPTLAEAGVWASIISAIAAAIALTFNARVMAQQQRSNDASTLFAVAANIRDAEARLSAHAHDPQSFRLEVNNYLNLLEIFAAAVNHRLFGRRTYKIARDRLITDLGMLLSNEITRDQIGDAVTSKETFLELLAFYTKNRAQVDCAVSVFTPRH